MSDAGVSEMISIEEKYQEALKAYKQEQARAENSSGETVQLRKELCETQQKILFEMESCLRRSKLRSQRVICPDQFKEETGKQKVLRKMIAFVKKNWK
jgi:hypothetical protein